MRVLGISHIQMTMKKLHQQRGVRGLTRRSSGLMCSHTVRWGSSLLNPLILTLAFWKFLRTLHMHRSTHCQSHPICLTMPISSEMTLSSPCKSIWWEMTSSTSTLCSSPIFAGSCRQRQMNILRLSSRWRKASNPCLMSSHNHGYTRAVKDLKIRWNTSAEMNLSSIKSLDAWSLKNTTN